MYVRSETQQYTFLPYWLLGSAITVIIRPLFYKNLERFHKGWLHICVKWYDVWNPIYSSI